MKSCKLILLYLLVPVIAISQGKIMLVGGGTELDTDWSWSNTPYQWAINQSTNKKVAIISYSLGGDPDWLSDYFISLGATEAANFEINTLDSANSQLTYDVLMSYDVLFFKGGDQSNYYSTYKNTKVTGALTDKYNAGGVIGGTSAGMAILSEVMYTAENNTVYPDEVLKNIHDGGITLKNDFVSILNNYIVDTHYIERGRFPRLFSFIGNWYLNNGELISGIGVDDRTAFCINDQNIGTAYGTGAVSIYSTNDFTEDQLRPVADSIHATHLTHGMSYDLVLHEMTSDYSREISPMIDSETGLYTIYLSGSAPLSYNSALLSDFLSTASSDVIIVSKNNSSLSQVYANYISENSSFEASVVNTAVNDDTCQNVSLRNAIRNSSAILFVDNEHEMLFNFLENDVTGQLLQQQLFKDKNVLSFIGEDSKLAGAFRVSNNNSDPLNAYYGNLHFEKGLELLNTSIIMPDTYDPSSSDYYENNAASVKYALANHRLKYGLYINEKSYVKFYQQEGESFFDSHGPYSSILLSNTGSYGAIADQQVNSAGNTRNVVGFDQMKYSLLSNSPIKIGIPVSSETTQSAYELEAPQALAATPAYDKINLSWEHENNSISGFTIERSENGLTFSVIGTTTDKSFIDNDNSPKENYQYRVAAFNDQQVSCYSNVAIVNAVTGINPDLPALKISPNPTHGSIAIEGLPANVITTITIYDSQGRIVKSINVTKDSSVDITLLASGIYNVTITNTKKTINRKIIVTSD